METADRIAVSYCRLMGAGRCVVECLASPWRPHRKEPCMPAPSPVVTCSGLSFAWPDGTAVFTDLSLVISPGRTGLDRRERVGQVDAAAADRRRAGARRRVGHRRGRTGLSAAEPGARRAGDPRRGGARRRGHPGGRGGDRGRGRQRGELCPGRRGLGRRGAGPGHAGPARPGAGAAGPADRRAVRRGGACCCAWRRVPAAPRRAAARRADQQPRPGRAAAAVRGGRVPGRARW